MAQRNIDAVLERIAQRHLRITTLELRQSDSLNFYDLAAWNLKEALAAAYQAGVVADIASKAGA